MTDLLTFLRDEWLVIGDNIWTFIIYGVFLFLMGFSVSWKIHDYTLEKKLHQLPEREELQAQLVELKSQNDDLKKRLHSISIGEYIQDLKSSQNENSIGEMIKGKN